MRGPTYQHGFYAPGKRRQAKYPSLWRGCVGAWSMGLGPTGATLRDWSGMRNHGTLTNMDPATDWVVSDGQYALDFDGTDDYVEITDRTPSGTPYSISVWASADVLDNTQDQITNSNNKFQIGVADPGMIYSYAPDYYVAWSVTWTLNTWGHHAFTIDHDVFLPYFNGVNRGVFSTTSISSGTGTLYLARYYNLVYGGNWFNGRIDDVRIYNRVLSPQEIKLLSLRRGIAYETVPHRVSYEVAAAAAVTRHPMLLGVG